MPMAVAPGRSSQRRKRQTVADLWVEGPVVCEAVDIASIANEVRRLLETEAAACDLDQDEFAACFPSRLQMLDQCIDAASKREVLGSMAGWFTGLADVATRTAHRLDAMCFAVFPREFGTAIEVGSVARDWSAEKTVRQAALEQGESSPKHDAAQEWMARSARSHIQLLESNALRRHVPMQRRSEARSVAGSGPPLPRPVAKNQRGPEAVFRY